MACVAGYQENIVAFHTFAACYTCTSPTAIPALRRPLPPLPPLPSPIHLANVGIDAAVLNRSGHHCRYLRGNGGGCAWLSQVFRRVSTSGSTDMNIAVIAACNSMPVRVSQFWMSMVMWRCNQTYILTCIIPTSSTSTARISMIFMDCSMMSIVHYLDTELDSLTQWTS